MASDWLTYIVANTVVPYAYELPIILAYPNGYSYRARFKEEWLDKALKAEIANLEGMRCLIVYRDFDTGDLYPLRYGQIRRLETYGEVVYIEYELGEIVQYHNSPDMRRQQLREFREHWRAEHPAVAATNRGQDHMRPLVFKSKYVPRIENPYLAGSEASREFESWSNICDMIADMTLYAEMGFLRIVDLGEDPEKTPVVLRDHRYGLRPGRSYELRVAQRVFRSRAGVPPHEVKFKCDGHGVRAITQHRRAVGKYDVLSFRFQTEKAISRTATAVLSLTGQMTEQEPFELELVSQVSPQWPVRGLLLAVFGGLGLLWPELFAGLGVGPTGEEVIKRVGTLLFVIGVMDSRSLFDYLSWT